MTQVDFQNQMNRLVNCFGKQLYNEERTTLIWKEVQFLSSSLFTKMVDNFIGSFRQGPLLPDFREAIARNRESTWVQERDIQAIAAQDLYKSLEDYVRGAVARGEETTPEFQSLMKWFGLEKFQSFLKPIPKTEEQEPPF